VLSQQAIDRMDQAGALRGLVYANRIWRPPSFIVMANLCGGLVLYQSAIESTLRPSHPVMPTQVGIHALPPRSKGVDGGPSPTRTARGR
jgi:hypothetical protein